MAAVFRIPLDRQYPTKEKGKFFVIKKEEIVLS